jgi:ABC-type lipoprotein export system ATPase subunit
MLWLRSLKVHKFRAVAPGTEIHFHDACNVLLGKNGTGKTTLLELISMALRADFSAIQNEECDLEFDLDLLDVVEGLPGDTRISIKTRLGTRVTESSDRPEWGMSMARIPWEQATIEAGSIRALYRREGNNVRIERDGHETETRSLPKAAAPLGKGLMFELVVLLISETVWSDYPSLASAFRFDESLSIFQRLTNEQKINIFKRGTSTGATQAVYVRDFVPVSLSERIRDHVLKGSAATSLTFRHEDLPFLTRLVALLGFESATLELSLLQRETGPEESEFYTFGEPRFLFTRKGGRSTIRHEQLSYGQKRMLALFYYLESNPTHLIADELVNGLHHEWIELVIEEIEKRQSFLSSQNPLLLDYLTFDSAEDARRSFTLCELDDADRMHWRNMSDDEAEAFHAAYEVGIQHVGEILRGKGLW